MTGQSIDKLKFPFQKAIVTGGAGFIGSHIVEELVGLGVHTVSVDNYFAGKRENLSHLKKFNNFEEVQCDVTDFVELKKLMDGVDVIFHQAASKKTICLNDPRRDLAINAEGTFNLLELARDFGVKKFVHASTGSVYGEARYFPQDELHPIDPTSYYGVSKLAGEKYVQAFAKLYNLDTTVLRYFHVYGPRQESSDVGGVVSIFIRRLLNGLPITIYGDGSQQRTFTYVKDVVAANIRAATKPIARGKTYNCASGIKVTVSQLADKVAAILRIPNPQMNYEPWMPGDIKVFEIDNRLIRRDLEIEFLKDFDLGLQQTVEWGRDFLIRDLVLEEC